MPAPAIPRLRDAGELRLHRIGTPTGLAVDDLLSSKIRPGRITDRYDDLLRGAGRHGRGEFLYVLKRRRFAPPPAWPLPSARQSPTG
jgi:hypothetical protein